MYNIYEFEKGKKFLDSLIEFDEYNRTIIFEEYADYFNEDLRKETFDTGDKIITPFKNLEEMKIRVVISSDDIKFYIGDSWSYVYNSEPVIHEIFKSDDWQIDEVIEFIQMLEIRADKVTRR